MPLYTRPALQKAAAAYVQKSTTRYDSRTIIKEAAKQPSDATFDIFLSHRYLDSDEILALMLDFQSMGHSVYVDWIVDDLDRNNVTRDTAERLRTRMRKCKSLFFAFSPSASESKWMPWELGFCDGVHGRVAVVPVLEQNLQTESFDGQEYLKLYPYITKEKPAPPIKPHLLPPGGAVQISDPVLWVQESSSVYTSFTSWLNGVKPTRH